MGHSQLEIKMRNLNYFFAFLLLIGLSTTAQEAEQITWEKDNSQMVLIPAGSFEMGDHFNEGESRELPVHRVTLDGFYMDKTEVTVGQFKAFLADSGYSWGGDWDQVAKYSPGDDHPMIYVTWGHAVAYAEWAGKRLPSEAEWEYAARGGLQGKRYPWGDEITHDDANYYGTGGKDTWEHSTAAVGSFGVNGYGLYDVAGNVWEWCADRYAEDYYASSPATNPQGPETGTKRVLRGGNWSSLTSNLRVAYRNYYAPDVRGNNYGFRCVSGLNFTTGPSAGGDLTSDETGNPGLTAVDLSPADFSWTRLDPASSSLTARLSVQPLAEVDTSSWDFSEITTVQDLSDQLSSQV